MARKKRSKPQVMVLATLEEVEQALAEIAIAKAQIKQFEGEAEEKIAKIRAEADAKTAPLRARIAELETALTNWAQHFKEKHFQTARSIELPHGIVGFRRTTKISISRDTLERLKQLGFHDAIKIKESVNRNVLATWPDERLAQVGARRVTKDEFFYEIKEEELS